MRAGRRSEVVRRALPLVMWVLGLAAVLAVAVALGSTSALAGPPLAGPGDLTTWAAGRPPVEAAFSVLRLVVIGLATYLLLGTALSVVARLLRAGWLLAVADAATSSWTRHVVELALGASLVAVPLAPVPAGAADRSAATAGELVPGAGGGEGVAAADDPVTGVAAQPGPPTMRRLDPPGQPGGASSEVVIGAGDHLWSVAERALATAWGRPPADDEVAPFWEQVVDVNHARLADPGNPDLLFVGQVVTVPAPPPAPPA